MRKHPEVRDLALYAGGELPVWKRVWMRRHVEHCSACTAEVSAFREAQLELQYTADDLPSNLNWNRLAAEMKANIRVGLAAGECVRSIEPAQHRHRPETWRFASAAAAIALMVMGGWWWRVSQPDTATPHTATVTQQQAKAPIEQSEIVLKATMGGIGLERGGSGFALAPGRGESFAVSAETKGVLKASYVDEESGQVTIHHVYAE
ncbi:MAG: hypothetical protein IT168_14170 [Bryobacterales bacterium]|nr:hypothetical protein [Bryobacterales bacterium]